MDINNYFVSRRDQFHKNTIQRIWRTNPYRNLINTRPFDLGEGATPTVRTLTHELPTAYPTSLTAVSVSNGTSDPYCAPAATTIKRGEVHRTFSLTQTAFDTDPVCLSDLRRAHDAAEAAAAFEKALAEYVNVWWGDYCRIKTLANIDLKVAPSSATALISTETPATTFTGLSDVPTADLTWDHLRQLYSELLRRGIADEYAVGVDGKGRPILPFIAGDGIIKSLFADDDVKEEVRYFDPKSNLKAFGYDGAIDGFLPIVDLFPLKYGASSQITEEANLTLANLIYPTVNADATVGRKYSANPYRALRADGGRADFEVAYILPKNVFELVYEPSGATEYAGMKFDPSNYLGEFGWINNKTFKGDNDLGNKGYYRADIRVGTKPQNPDLGVAILAPAKK